MRFARWGRFIGADRLAALEAVALSAVRSVGSVTVWNVNSTAGDGGVAEMLRFLVGYAWSRRRRFGASLAALLARPAEMTAMGRRAHRHVRAHYLSDRHLIDDARLVEHLLAH